MERKRKEKKPANLRKSRDVKKILVEIRNDPEAREQAKKLLAAC